MVQGQIPRGKEIAWLMEPEKWKSGFKCFYLLDVMDIDHGR